MTLQIQGNSCSPAIDLAQPELLERIQELSSWIQALVCRFMTFGIKLILHSSQVGFGKPSFLENLELVVRRESNLQLNRHAYVS